MKLCLRKASEQHRKKQREKEQGKARKERVTMSVTQSEKLWEGGSTLKLISHVFEMAMKRRNKYKDLFEALVVTFQHDVEKVMIMQDCVVSAEAIK